MDAKQLHEIIDEEAEKRTAIELWELSDAIVDRLPTKEIKSVLYVTMRRYVAERLKLGTRVALKAVEDEVQEPTPITGRKPQSVQGPSRREVAHGAWKAKLDVLVTVSDNSMRRLGSLTLAEVQLQVARRTKLAKDITEQAVWYARIAEAMHAVGAKTVAELPETTLRPLLEKVAA